MNFQAAGDDDPRDHARVKSRQKKSHAAEIKRVFLFLQGPISPFFPMIAKALEARGARAIRVNLCFGDFLFWRRGGAVNYRGTREGWPAFIAELMDREGVTDILLLGEQRYYHRMAIEAAQARGIVVAVTDFGYLRPDWITLEQDGMSGESLFPREPGKILELARQVPKFDPSRKFADSFWNMALWDMVYHLSSSLLWMFFPHYHSHQVHGPIPVYIGTGARMLLKRFRGPRTDRLVKRLRAARTAYYVFPLQMETDFQLRAYSPFQDLRVAIRLVVDSFARNAPADSRLIIKVHPLDPGMVSWRRFSKRAAAECGVSHRVHYVDGGALSPLLADARGVVTINSTVGIWALLAGRPLKVLGQAVYDVDPVTFGGSLDAFWTGATPPDSLLRDALIGAIAGTIQIRGVFYQRAGLRAAVTEACERLHRRLLNSPAYHQEAREARAAAGRLTRTGEPSGEFQCDAQAEASADRPEVSR
jgi:capsular polysaccharide export protein